MEEEERHLSTVEIWTEKHGHFARSHDRGALGNSKAINSLEASPRFGPCLEVQAPSTQSTDENQVKAVAQHKNRTCHQSS